MMAGRKKWVTVATIVLSATLGWYACAKIRYQLELPLYQMASCLRLYIREFHTFPQSRDDLIQKRYLKIDRSDGQESYSVRFDLVEAITRKTTDKTVSTTWYEIDFSAFTLCYGAAVDNLVLKEGLLCQTGDSRPVLLFDGPHKWLLSGTYSVLSADLYREMELQFWTIQHDPEKYTLEQGTNSYIHRTHLEDGTEIGIIELKDGSTAKYWFRSHHLGDGIGGTWFVMSDGQESYMAGCFCCEVLLPEEQFASLDALRQFIQRHDGISP